MIHVYIRCPYCGHLLYSYDPPDVGMPQLLCPSCKKMVYTGQIEWVDMTYVQKKDHIIKTVQQVLLESAMYSMGFVLFIHLISTLLFEKQLSDNYLIGIFLFSMSIVIAVCIYSAVKIINDSKGRTALK